MAQSRNDIFLALTENMFTLTSNACECMTDIEHLSKTEVRQTLKVRSRLDAPLRFVFAPEKGLVSLTSAGAVASERILTELISLPEGDVRALEEFFEKYGFLFPVSGEELEAVEMKAVWGVVNRVRAVVILMSELEAPRKDYMKILALTLYLLMETPAEIKVLLYDAPYITCDHSFSNVYANIAQISETDDIRDAFVSDTYRISDTMFRPYYNLSISEYNDILSDTSARPGAAESELYKTITYLYRNAVDVGNDCRLIIDFLFHFQSQIGIIESWTAQGKLTFYESDTTRTTNYAREFGDQMKQALVRIAKNVIKEELDYNLRGVLPIYDADAMAPSWFISDLLSALYFSVFYMHPGTELYRRCANTTCNRYFLVKTTSSRQKYCSASCSNAAAQRSHRKRLKERSAGVIPNN